uniref:Uncharacterized protein n=1 Tax=Myoviridae sp. ct3Pt8 TaxID=2826608 RepID=A0A8S5MN85_9CAUD|nr:MAG TPA: hypothetical protein [Myoviridae sp. ct3Pt8]
MTAFPISKGFKYFSFLKNISMCIFHINAFCCEIKRIFRVCFFICSRAFCCEIKCPIFIFAYP